MLYFSIAKLFLDYLENNLYSEISCCEQLMVKAIWLGPYWWFLGTENYLQPIVSKTTGTHSYHHKKLSFANHMRELGREPS